MMRVEEAERRCRALSDVLHSSSPLSCHRTLLRLLSSELKFLSTTSATASAPISSNIGHLESVVHILQQPPIAGVSRVCASLPSPSNGVSVHVDVVCNFNKSPVWILVSDRNPNYVSWSPSHKTKGLRRRLETLLEAARSSSSLKPASLILFFSHGLSDTVSSSLRLEFGATALSHHSFVPHCEFSEELGDGWVCVNLRSYANACAFEIKVGDCFQGVEPIAKKLSCEDQETTRLPSQNDFCSLISKMRLAALDVQKPELYVGEDLINFDTTALIALVSGISNGGAEKLLAAPESELRTRFKCNYEFVIAQATSELQSPMLEEMGPVISDKIGIICKSVVHEFKELVGMCGGPNERSRADQLLKSLVVVPDSPSTRMVGLPTTRKIALKNKVVFGTGDYWSAPTLTANAGFVRAIFQTGMSLLTIQHRPRALTGD